MQGVKPVQGMEHKQPVKAIEHTLSLQLSTTSQGDKTLGYIRISKHHKWYVQICSDDLLVSENYEYARKFFYNKL